MSRNPNAARGPVRVGPHKQNVMLGYAPQGIPPLALTSGIPVNRTGLISGGPYTRT